MDCLRKRVTSGTAPSLSSVALVSLTLASLSLASLAPADAATFRVTTKIFAGADRNPATEHQIMFDEGLVYDLPQTENRFVTVYDEAQNRVTILDRQTQVQTVLGTESLERITAQARAAAGTPEQQEQLGLNAKVEPSDRMPGYTIQFGTFEYHASSQTPEDPSIANDYGRFAILESRLNIARRRGLPPFGRMTLNMYMATRGELPSETTLTLRRGDKPEEYRSTHQLDELTPADRKKIEKVQGMMALYREVDLKEFPK